MNYKNSEIKIIDLINHLKSGKINLSPIFQRGRVWKLKLRKKLLQNMVDLKPIPAIFLYKKESGETYTYNILDGKQRIESLILFIGNQRNNLKIDNWNDYFFSQTDKKNINFPIDIDGRRCRFSDLSDEKVRAFGEYVIPTIEINMGEDTELNEIISLFVDINQYGVAVDRFDIVRAMCRTDRIMQQTLNLIAKMQRRKKDVFYKQVSNEFTYIFKRTSLIEKAISANNKVNRMWERLLEISIFEITKQHRKPVDVLKGFISSRAQHVGVPHVLSRNNLKKLRNVFRFLKQAYSSSHQLSVSKLAKDMTHFYTMVTAFLNSDLIDTVNHDSLIDALNKFSAIIARDGKGATVMKNDIKQYVELSSKHTTDVDRRVKREEFFVKIIRGFLN